MTTHIQTNIVKCFGDNSQGQLAGTTDAGFTWIPQLLPLGGQYVWSLAVGGAHLCAISGYPGDQGTLYLSCWGANDHGQLGQGTVGPPVTTPTRPVGF